MLPAAVGAGRPTIGEGRGGLPCMARDAWRSAFVKGRCMGKSAMRTREPDRGLRICKLLRSALVLIVVALTFACCSHASAANAATAMPGRAALQQTPGRVIVKYSLSEPLAATRAAAAEMGAQVAGRVRTFGLKTTGRFVVVSSDTLSTGDVMRKYSADQAVQYDETD